MNKFPIVLFCLLACSFSFAQNNLRCENLAQLSFPSKFDSIESKGVKVFYSVSSGFLYECSASRSGDTLDQKKFYRQLQLFVEGFFSSETWKYYNREQVDTTIGGVEGTLVHAYQPSKPMKLKETFNLPFIILKWKRLFSRSSLAKPLLIQSKIIGLFKSAVRANGWIHFLW